MSTAWKGGIALCLALAVLIGCGAADSAAVEPTLPTQSAAPPPARTTSVLPSTLEPTAAWGPTTLGPPTPPMTPATAPRSTLGPTSLILLPTPTRPPPLPVTPVELPPTPALPLDQALGQFAKDALLYVNSQGFLMLTESLVIHTERYHAIRSCSLLNTTHVLIAG